MMDKIQRFQQNKNSLISFKGFALILLLTVIFACNQPHGKNVSLKSENAEKAATGAFARFCDSTDKTGVILDLTGREISIPDKIDTVICSGGGCLRLLTYLQAHDRIAAVDGIEVRGSPIDARPYAIANPQFKKYPIFGEFRGHDNPELISGLKPRPDVIFKMAPGGGSSPDILQKKTGIPVIMLRYGNLTYDRQLFDRSLCLMAKLVGKQQRAKEVIAFIDSVIADLKSRIDSSSMLTCYIGALGQSGPHGIQSTNPVYAPFEFLEIKNVASLPEGSERVSSFNVSKEQIIVWDPDIIFIDISTLRLPGNTNALAQLHNDPAFSDLKAVKNNRVYGLFPNNSYNENTEVVLANAYFIGKIVYPETFADIDPVKKAEEISVFLNGGTAFAELNKMFDNVGFTKINIK